MISDLLVWRSLGASVEGWVADVLTDGYKCIVSAPGSKRRPPDMAAGRCFGGVETGFVLGFGDGGAQVGGEHHLGQVH